MAATLTPSQALLHFLQPAVETSAADAAPNAAITADIES
jgi:hypothetical protein